MNLDTVSQTEEGNCVHKMVESGGESSFFIKKNNFIKMRTKTINNISLVIHNRPSSEKQQRNSTFKDPLFESFSEARERSRANNQRCSKVQIG